MNALSKKVAVDDNHLNELSKRVEASDQKIAKYDNRSAENQDDDDGEEKSPDRKS